MLRQSDQQVLGIDLNCSESTEALLAHVLPVSKIAHTTVAYETAALRNFDPAQCSQMGHWRLGRASSKSGHVRNAAESGSDFIALAAPRRT